MITRIHKIHETSFNTFVYMIVEIIMIILGLIFTKIDQFIKDLVNRFGYPLENRAAEEVSLKPFLDLKKIF
jgi:hypothetical protein